MPLDLTVNIGSGDGLVPSSHYLSQCWPRSMSSLGFNEFMTWIQQILPNQFFIIWPALFKELFYALSWKTTYWSDCVGSDSVATLYGYHFHIPQWSIQNRNTHIAVLNGPLWDMEQVLVCLYWICLTMTRPSRHISRPGTGACKSGWLWTMTGHMCWWNLTF